MNRVVLIGVGKGGRALLSLLHEDPEVEVLGVATRRPDSSGLAYARELGVFTTTDIDELLSLPGIDVIIDASGSNDVANKLKNHDLKDAEVIAGLASSLMWNMVEERKRREADQHALYEIGLLLTTAKSEQEVLEAIIESACELIGVPAASIALFNEKKKELCLSCARGFSKEFEAFRCWPVRKGGLSDRILKSEEPLVFEDATQVPGFDNKVMLNEGIRAVAAAPLRTRGRTIGVLYVDDFKARTFDDRERSLLRLLANQAALAIEKTQLLEDKVRLATTDGLTGLYNYRHFQDVLRSEVERGARYAQNFCLAILDLDFFKSINDRMGHTMGDEVLRRVAQVLSETLRATDFLARYGGEEFAIILPHTTMTESRHVAEKLRRAISEIEIKTSRGKTLHLTTSIGIADFPASGKSSDDMIAAADSALLLAKRSGRNRVCYFPDVGTSEDTQPSDTGLSSRLRGHDFLTVGALVAALQEGDLTQKSQALVAAEYFARSLDLSREEKEALLLGVQIHRRGHRKGDPASMAGQIENEIAGQGSLLDLPGGLNENEWVVIRKHATSVGRVVRALQGLNLLTTTILHHHERWDGQGYPDGLTQEQIPLLARILSICEAYQELVDAKPWGAGLTANEALAALRSRAGADLDPALVELFCRAGDTTAAAETNVATTAQKKKKSPKRAQVSRQSNN